ncbi:UPF0149 family protein [Marinicella sp. S1101]|uniref:UPF0149 family protein n=1 Tax=Marinicella marina TaxID=2996016 RepID=UPI002260CBF6|nr:UPF0149 family protein [Marinicella marina]MCX7553769.1 UPF0149 family protein [Marinicella marina]MDJ1140844.1 UPF0149 family protein [Marinicella marina]
MIPYQPFAEHLKSIGVLASPSELHAQASAALCVNHNTDFEFWLQQMVNEYCVENPQDTNFKMVMSAVFDYAKEKLAKDDYGYDLLLPQEESTLADRVAVLAEWVATFLAGLGTAGMTEINLSQEGSEFLQDMAQIARIENDSEEVTGEELDFMEITEYIRTGVMMLYIELNAMQTHSKSIN